MAQTQYVERVIPQISLADFENRIEKITTELIDAAENVGFFTLVDHGISKEDIESMFLTSKSFFDLPDATKATVPWNANNVGWEKNSQIRPSTGKPDSKESYQLQFGDNMQGLWVADEHLPGFQTTSLAFMRRVQHISERLMRCFARGLGFPDDFFIQCHDVSRSDSQTTMRLPGRESVTEFGIGDRWTKLEAKTGEIVCNIGDLLMSWSDDRFKSTFHRVKAPCEPGDYFGDRYSIAYFNQPCKDALIQGPLKKYPMVTGAQFTESAMKRNFAALQEKLKMVAAA